MEIEDLKPQVLKPQNLTLQKNKLMHVYNVSVVQPFDFNLSVTEWITVLEKEDKRRTPPCDLTKKKKKYKPTNVNHPISTQYKQRKGMSVISVTDSFYFSRWARSTQERKIGKKYSC